MEQQNKLRMLDFHFKTLKLTFNESFVWPKDSPVNLNPILSKRFISADEDKALVILTFSIDGDDKPFNSIIELVGKFECKNWKKDEIGTILIKENTVNILFPYLRQAISTLTSMAGVPTYTLPIINTKTIKELNEK